MDIQSDDADWQDFLARARAELDWDELAAIGERLPKRRDSYRTYLDAELWFGKLWREAVRLNLHRSAPKRVLDLGTGPGYFTYICRSLGHDAIGLELPHAGLDEFQAWMGLEVVGHVISAKQPLPTFGKKFDLATSFRVPFNKKRATREQRKKGSCELFSLDEWTFFLDDLRDNVLRPGGQFSMKMNTQPAHHVGPRYGDPELMQLFASRGAVLGNEKSYVTFDPLL